MRFLNGLLVIAVVAFMTACGGGAKTGNTEGTGTDSASTTETANTENTEKKNEETTSSETKAPKDMLAQKWMMDGEAAIASLPEERRPKTDEEKQKMMERAQQVTMQFNADGTYVGVRGGRESKGTWTLSEDGKTLTTKEEGKEKEEVLAITEMGADKMVFEVGEGERKSVITMVPFKAKEEGTTETKEGEKKEGETKEGEKKEGEKKEETTEEKK